MRAIFQPVYPVLTSQALNAKQLPQRGGVIAVRQVLVVLSVLVLAVGTSAWAGNTQVAVAANFAAPMKRIAQQFSQDTGHTATLVFGATGQLFANIQHGAPFDVLLAADQHTPQALVQSGLAVAQSRFTYATGRLALWSAQPNLSLGPDTLKSGNFKRLAVASPALAPYGLAAQQTLASLGISVAAQSRIVQGSSVTQAFQFVATGNADIGFVAVSQIMANGQIERGSAWLVPAALHAPIRQDAVLLQRATGNEAASALMQYMRSAPAQNTLRAFGYE